MAILASIDIGTNTLRLLVAEFKKDGSFKEIYSKRKITRLGEGLNTSGILGSKALKKAIHTLKDFKESIDKFNIEDFSAVATSAVREALNRVEFIKRVKDEVGIDIKVINGKEEAGLVLQGVIAGLSTTSHLSPPTSLLVMDIGGGSTEFILTQNLKPNSSFLTLHFSLSISLGVVHLSEELIKNDPPLQIEIERTDREIIKSLLGAKKSLGSIPEKTIFVGTAGTITTLAAIEQGLDSYDHLRIHNYILKKGAIKEIFNRLKSMTLSQRRKIPALESGREDLIIPGTLIVLRGMETFGFDRMTVSDYGLREGILVNLWKKYSQNQKASKMSRSGTALAVGME
ncbi:MAG: Ppx/GppA phosphatase family protein [Nitrospirota bacterium]